MTNALADQLQKPLLGLSDLCCSISKIIIIVFILAISFATLASVIFRYVLQDPLMWSEDASKFMMVWIGFFGSSTAIRHKGHVALTLFVTKLPKKWQFTMGLVGALLLLGFLFVFVFYGFSQAIKNPAISWGLDIQLKWVMLGLPISGIFMIVHVLYMIVEQFFTGKAEFGEELMESVTV
jgi:TRAP-type transport system small permease protein